MRTTSIKILLALCVPFLAQACEADIEPSDNETAERVPLAKGDAIGSCAGEGEVNFCGGPSEGNCWCDDLCEDYGDCCSDKAEVCDGAEPEPVLCLSDDACETGEVCDHSECLSNCPEGQLCPAVCWGQCLPAPADEGCASDADCGSGEYCNFAEGCGDGEGTCEQTPEFCIEIFAPVCGCDGQTYSNDCFAASAGVNVASEGPCEEPPPADSCEGNCGGNAGSCWCDDLCTQYGDCCDDYADACAPEPEPEPIEFETCEEAVSAFAAETDAIRSCTVDAECGQVLAGTSCGCTRNWVARTDADIGQWQEIRDAAQDLGCNLPGTISTCDCPPTDGFRCHEGTCTWNYTGF